ncbi:hypothetical protein D9B83_23235 [Serratia marcescens]|nr:hypothetical protein AM470_17995 [Serratia marcescens]PHY88793.1 hypothetical protein CS370_02355 [Serratia marcescens]RTF32247.1 hypothetical protein D9B83_23235 [Serratia marcescens]
MAGVLPAPLRAVASQRSNPLPADLSYAIRLILSPPPGPPHAALRPVPDGPFAWPCSSRTPDNRQNKKPHAFA